MSVHRLGIVALLFCCLIACQGCSGGTRLNPGTSRIDIRVVVVLGPNELIGSTSNYGCRLSAQEIENIVDQAQQNAGVFGSNTQLVWDGVINTAVDPTVNSPAGLSRSRSDNDFLFVLLAYPNAFGLETNQDKITIFFTGGFPLWAATLAPGSVGTPQFGRGFIRISDGDHLDDGTFPAVYIQRRLTLEHELGHYLSNNMTNRCFANGTRCYDAGGHINNRDLLMCDGGMVPPGDLRVLDIPGKEAKTDGSGGEDELGIISTRIRTGTWNNP